MLMIIKELTSVWLDVIYPTDKSSSNNEKDWKRIPKVY